MNSRRIGAAISLVVLAGCAGMCPKPPPPAPPVVVEKPVVKDTACDWDAPIVVNEFFIATLQSNPTQLGPVAEQILKHNKTGADRCGWKPVTKSN
jgi:hypothetical protein